MEVIMALPLLAIPLLLPLLAGAMAKSFNRNFWLWFWIAIPLPLIAHCILICLPERDTKVKAVENNEIYDHLFIDGEIKKTG